MRLEKITKRLWEVLLPLVLIFMSLTSTLAAQIDGHAPGAGSSDSSPQADWHGGHRHGGKGRGGDGGDAGGSGGVIIGFPSPTGPDAPNRYPRMVPAPPPDSEASAQLVPWPVWYYCDQPGGYYPYVKVCSKDWQRLPVLPPPPGSALPFNETSWERCDDPAGYFPYVAQCRRQWESIPASIPVPGDYPDGVAIIGQWFYCEDTKGYLPYVGSCPHVWRTVPAIPPPTLRPASVSSR